MRSDDEENKGYEFPFEEKGNPKGFSSFIFLCCVSLQSIS